MSWTPAQPEASSPPLFPDAPSLALEERGLFPACEDAPAPAPPETAGTERCSPDELAGLRLVSRGCAASLGPCAPAPTPAAPAAGAPAALPPLPASAPGPAGPSPRRGRRARWGGLLRRLRLSARVGFGALVAYVLLFSFSVVRGSSMRPGIEDGDRILIDPLMPALFGIERGDVVVLRCPLDPSLDYIKRVVGLPGDHIVLEAGRLFVNGVEVSEPYVAAVDRRSRVRTTVREGHYFVLGDNRPHSSDSREFGQVPVELVRGTVEVRVWPPDRIGRVR